MPNQDSQKKLPIGIQTFREIREENYYYVDKTAFVQKLVEQGKYFFLSRPRRFGKSLLIETFAELFIGNEVLFRGLAIHKQWDWQLKFPVIQISFAEGVLSTEAALDQRIREILQSVQQKHGINCQNQSIAGIFSELVSRLHHKTGKRVVILVDEYDKPILDNLAHPETAIALRDGLRNLYSVITRIYTFLNSKSLNSAPKETRYNNSKIKIMPKNIWRKMSLYI